jgi:type IV pilus assembly protein PilV
MSTRRREHTGASLIEVLVTILILSFGLLSLGNMMAYAVQAPKLAAYRATATMLASAHLERLRRNASGFYQGHYEQQSTYNESFGLLEATSCAFPDCNPGNLAEMDRTAFASSVRQALPAGGVMVGCDPYPCTSASSGNVWVIWQEPESRAAVNAGASDNCPSQVANYNNPRPRCLYLRFKP